MCFQSKLSKKAAVIESRFKATFLDDSNFEPADVIKGFAFPKTPVITDEDAGSIQMVNWA